MKLTLAQLNPTIANFEGNLNKAEKAIQQAHLDESDLIVFSELYLTGYPPRDLLERLDFIRESGDALDRLCDISKKYPTIGILMGTIEPTSSRPESGFGAMRDRPPASRSAPVLAAGPTGLLDVVARRLREVSESLNAANASAASPTLPICGHAMLLALDAMRSNALSAVSPVT